MGKVSFKVMFPFWFPTLYINYLCTYNICGYFYVCYCSCVGDPWIKRWMLGCKRGRERKERWEQRYLALLWTCTLYNKQKTKGFECICGAKHDIDISEKGTQTEHYLLKKILFWRFSSWITVHFYLLLPCQENTTCPHTYVLARTLTHPHTYFPAHLLLLYSTLPLAS